MDKKSSTSSSSSTRKRQRDHDSVPESSQDDAVFDDNDSLTKEENLLFSDTLVALQMMRGQFPRIEKVSIEPFVLRSQLYSSVKDRTQVDRDLEALRRDRVLRMFKLNTGQDDHAIMFVDDYIKQDGWKKRRKMITKFLRGLRHMSYKPSWKPASVTKSFAYYSHQEEMLKRSTSLS